MQILSRLVYQIKAYKKLNQPNEAFTLGVDTALSRLVYQIKAYKKLNQPNEAFTLGVDTTLNEISYAGTHVKPV